MTKLKMDSDHCLALALLVVGLVLVGSPEPASSQGNNVHVTTITDHDGDIFELANGGIFKKTSYGYVGYLGFRPEALLYADGSEAKLWIEGHGVASGDLMRRPSTPANAEAALVNVMQVRGNGEFLETTTGALLEIDPVDVVTTAIWISPFGAILLDDGRLFNLDESSEVVRVITVR